jgi:hypothetical protein
MLHPALSFERPHNGQRIFLVGDLFHLVTALRSADGADHALGFGVFITGARTLVQLPAGARCQANGPHHADGIFEKSVITGKPQLTRVNVGRTVQRIEQQAPGAFVERQRHCVRCKVAPVEIGEDCGWPIFGPSGLRKGLGTGGRNLQPGLTAIAQVNGLRRFVLPPDREAGLLELFAKFERIGADRNVQVAHGGAADNVTHSTAGQKYSRSLGAGQFRDRIERLLLHRRQLGFKQLDIIRHALLPLCLTAAAGGR